MLWKSQCAKFREWRRNDYESRSGDSDCFCRPRSSSTYAGSSRRRLLPPPCTALFLLFVVSVVAALFSLTYFAVSLHGQISALTMHLEAGKWFVIVSDCCVAKWPLEYKYAFDLGHQLDSNLISSHYFELCRLPNHFCPP
jgi:hypothetical protein